MKTPTMQRLLAASLGVFMSAVIAGGCRDAQNGREVQKPSSAQSPTPVSLRLKWVFDPGFAGEMVAARGGFFRQRGIDVTLRPGGFEADPIRLVASGADDFGVAGADAFLLARSRGVPIVAVAAGYLESPVVFYAKQESGIRRPEDFAQRRVGIQGGQDTETVYAAMMRKAGVDRSRIREVPVKFDLGPFLAGQVDVWPGYAATQSYILRQRGIPFVTIIPREFGIQYLGTVYFTTEKMIAEHPEHVGAFVGGLIDGWNYTYSQPDSAIPLISAYDRAAMPEELVRANLQDQRPFILPNGARYAEFDMADWQALQQVLLQEGLLSRPVNLDSAVTIRFLDRHYQRP
jgi:ABC-type nitrate/sulfonate/bicarbonate transport system substrate-binding protein